MNDALAAAEKKASDASAAALKTMDEQTKKAAADLQKFKDETGATVSGLAAAVPAATLRASACPTATLPPRCCRIAAATLLPPCCHAAAPLDTANLAASTISARSQLGHRPLGS